MGVELIFENYNQTPRANQEVELQFRSSSKQSLSFRSIWYESGEELEHQNETLFIKFKFDETFDAGLERCSYNSII